MPDLEAALDRIAEETSFAGVVRVDRDGTCELVRAYGLAHRGYGIPNAPDTLFAIASGTKGLTALTILSLVDAGALRLSSTARSILGDDLPLIGDDVTIEHLLAHRSGIGDYLDEDLDLDLADYLLPVGAHELAATEGYLRVLDGHPAKFPADARFSYCNGGYVVLALVAERTGGRAFADLVEERVCRPAGMLDTAFLRSDELPARAAVGYLPVDGGWRSNVFHLPVRGSGDGGIYTTASDVSALWRALFAGRIVSSERVRELARDRSGTAGDRGYGLGFWLPAGSGALALEGCDTGVSFHSRHDPVTGRTTTVIATTSDGAWPIVELLDRG